MEIPEFCTRSTPRMKRKLKTEMETDPDYAPGSERKVIRGGKAFEPKPGPSSRLERVPLSFSVTAESSGSDDGLLVPMVVPLSVKKPWEERSVVRRSKTLASERRKPAPKLHFVERAQYSIENWKDKVEESMKKREEVAKKTATAETNAKKRRGPRGPYAKSGGRKRTEEISSDDEDDDDDDDDVRDDAEERHFDYQLLESIIGDVDPLTQLLDNSGVDPKNFDLQNLPYFIMGVGKGEPGGPPAFEFNSLWSYELDPLSANDTDETIEENAPWKNDPTIPDFQPRVLAVGAVFTVGRQLDLQVIAENTRNIEFNPSRCAPLIMRIRDPKSTALIFASGRIIISGAKSVEECKQAARKYARIIQRLGFNAKVLGFTIQNISVQCHLQFRVRIHHLAKNKLYGPLSYEPELFSGLIIPLEYPRVKAIIFCTGSVLMTGAKSMEDVEEAMKAIYPLVKMYGH